MTLMLIAQQTTMSPLEILGTSLIVLIFLVVVLGGYFLPTIIGAARGVRNLGSLFIVNLFLGWLLIGWVIALAWSFADVKNQKQKIVYQHQPPSGQPPPGQQPVAPILQNPAAPAAASNPAPSVAPTSKARIIRLNKPPPPPPPPFKPRP